MKKAAVVVVSYNGMKYLAELFQSLLSLSYPKEYYKVTIVDNASIDGTSDYVKANAPWANLISLKKNKGFAGGNNIAMKDALKEGYEYIVLLNADTVLDSEWLAALISAAQSCEKIGAVQSLVLFYNNKEIINSWGNEFFYLGLGYCGGYKKRKDEYLAELNRKHVLYPQCAYAMGASVLYKAEVLKRVGLFNEEHFIYPEDFDLSWRIRLAGYDIVTAPRSLAYHKYEFGRNSMRKFYWIERNRHLILFANYQTATLLLLIPMLVLFELGVIFFFVMNKGFELKWKGWLYAIRNIPRAIKEKREVARYRKRSDREILQLFTGVVEFSVAGDAYTRPLQLLRIFNIISKAYFSFVKFVVRW